MSWLASPSPRRPLRRSWRGFEKFHFMAENFTKALWWGNDRREKCVKIAGSHVDQN
jgi:hypothetical protein